MKHALGSKELVALFGAIVQTSVVLACGGGGSTSGSSSGTNSSSGSCGTSPSPERYTVPYTPRTDCLDASVDDAGDDAGDGGLDASSCDPDEDPNLCQRHCQEGFAGGMNQCTVSADKKTVSCTRYYLCGRRFEDLDDLVADETSPLATFAAHSAYLEAASVHSFRRMAEEIEAHQLGDDLAAWARRAAREEAQHARMMTSIARSLGARGIPRVKKPARRRRSLEEIAVENAVEGCVHETYGALLATYQATHAEDPRLRAVFGRIARDETSHAELAWALAAAIEARLDAAALHRVKAARLRAFVALGSNAGPDLSAADRVRLGHPPAGAERHLARALAGALAA